MSNNLNQFSKFIKDPIYHEIEFNDKEKWLFDLTQTKEFLRLARIKQLGECHKIFVSATHNRYSHSLGVYHVTKQFLNHLKPDISSHDRNAILAAALLHDVGHAPRSHSFEVYTSHNHEKMTTTLIKSNLTEINKILLKNNIDPQMVANIIEHKKVPPFYYQIISSQIDADRLDYLVRDSYFVGTNNGSIDIGMIIKWSRIVDNKIVFLEKAVHLIESTLFSRYQMFRQIYLHPKVVCYEKIMTNIFLRLKELHTQNYQFKNIYNLLQFLDPYFNDKPYDIQSFLAIDDNIIDVFIKSLLEEKDEVLQTLVKSYLFKNQFVCENYSPKHYQHLHHPYFYDSFDITKSIFLQSEKIIIMRKKDNKLEEISKFCKFLTKDSLEMQLNEHLYFYINIK